MAEAILNLKLELDEARLICTALEVYLCLLGLRNTGKILPTATKGVIDALEDVRVEAQKVVRLQAQLMY